MKIFRYGSWETVVVDDLVPCKFEQASMRWEPVFAKSSSEGKEMWTIIAEKAWAKVNGSYTAIEGGIAEDMLVYLTGGASISINMDSPNVLSDASAASRLWERLLAARPERIADGRKFFMCAGGVRGNKVAGNTDPSKLGHAAGAAGGLVSDHAYSLLEAIEVGALKLMKLRNPVRAARPQAQLARTRVSSGLRRASSLDPACAHRLCAVKRVRYAHGPHARTFALHTKSTSTTHARMQFQTRVQVHAH